MMIPIYHDIVGRGMVMELAFSIDRDGLVEDTHAAVYTQIGEWVRQCYGSPISETSGKDDDTYNLVLQAGVSFDRFQLREDIATGQRVRRWSIARQDKGSEAWASIANGTSIGRKWIVLLNATTTLGTSSTLRLTIDRAVAPPQIAQFAAFKACATH